MATRKKKRSLIGKAAIGGLKLGGGTGVGALIGATEAGLGMRASQGVRGVLAVAGIAAEVFLDEKSSAVARSAGQAALYGSSSVTGYSFGKNGMEKIIQTRRQASIQAMREDMDKTAAAEEAVTESAARAKAKG